MNRWEYKHISLVAQNYLEMLELELQDKPFIKAEYHRSLMQQLPGRTNSSIQMLCQNLSAVLEEMGLPYIQGYKPLRHISDLQRQVLKESLANNERITTLLGNPIKQSLENTAAQYFVNIPQPHPTRDKKRNGQTITLVQRDYALEEAQNRELGRKGEMFILEIEQARLRENGQDDLAARVEWVADTQGDGLGYDILSFEDDGTPRYIEVKTTHGKEGTSFFLSANELAFAKANPSSFYLYRVFNFTTDPKAFILPGNPEQYCRLEPISYQVNLK